MILHQVTRVSDVVSVGQQLCLMCIGQDVRGNIKLSLKAASPLPGSGTKNVVEGSVPVSKEATNVWASDGDVANGQNQELLESKDDFPGANPSTSSTPVILIRSAAECDEEEKASGLGKTSKSKPKSTVASKSNHKPKKSPIQNDESDSEFLSSVLFSSANAKGSTSFSQKEREKISESLFGTQNGDDDHCNFTSQLDTHDNKGVKPEALITTKNLKLGTKVVAKVYQVRARGLVLDLGGGIRGMYRFEVCIPLFLNRIFTMDKDDIDDNNDDL